MEENRPLLVTTEDVSKLPILIVDKKGLIGSALTKVLREQFLIVVVTAHAIERHDNVIHVPYRRKIPMIPDNAYSHLFIVYNGESELLDMLTSFEKKAAATKARFLFITSLLYSSQKLFAKLRRQEYQHMQTVLFGEAFDNAIKDANEVNFFIHQARAYGRIEVPQEGLGHLYPILFDDVLTSIVSLAFALERPKETIFLFPHHILNEISVARLMQKINPLIKVDFSKRKSAAGKYYIPSGGLFFYRDYNLEEKLRKIDLSRVGRRVKVPQKKIQLKIPHPEETQSKTKISMAILLAVFIAPILAALICAFVGAGSLYFSEKQMEQGNLAAAQSSATFAQGSFFVADALGPSMLLPQLIIPQQKSQFIDAMDTGQTVAFTMISIDQSLQKMKDIYEGKSLEPKNDFLQSLATIKNALLTMQKLEAEEKIPKPILQKIQKINATINLVEETIDTWPNILGFEGKKTYMILFQNNMELRPGGGFIGSYGLLPVENGKLGKLQIHDVYDADGQLTQPVQPPYGLQRYLGVAHWFLRDSNFDPDFTRDAVQAAQFLRLETGQRVDGVISVDIMFLKNLIGIVGPIYVQDYKVTVTPDNFYLLTETNAEKNFFPGSTQKKDFLRSLTTALMDKLSSEKQLPYEKANQMLLSSIQQKDLLFTFSDPSVQNVFTVNGLSDSLWDGRSPQKNMAMDYLGIVDANVGANKANYYVKRSISQQTTLDDLGSLQTTLDATYTNTATKASPFGGDYKDYVRFVVPTGTELVSIAFDGKTQDISPAVTDPSVFTSPDFTPPPGLEVDQTDEMGKSVIGFFFIVPEGATRTVSISYRTPSGIDTSAVAFAYNLQLFKEPGAGDDPYQLSVTFPNNFKAVASNAGLSNVGGKLLFIGNLSEDRTFTASFSKK